MYYRTAQLEETPILKLDETLEYAKFKSKLAEHGSYQGLMPGREWYVQAVMHGSVGIYKDVLIYGPAYVAFVWNRSGGTLSQGALTKWYTKTSSNITSGTVSSITKASEFNADEEVGNMVYIVDDAGGAGAAPEGEFRFITKNTADVLYVQPDFSAAPAANDDILIRSRCNVVASTAGDTRAETAGVVLAPDGIADNYGGWIVRWGIVGALVKASTTITADKSLIADAGRLTISSTSDNGLSLAYSLVNCGSDIVSDLIPVAFDARSILAVSA